MHLLYDDIFNAKYQKQRLCYKTIYSTVYSTTTSYSQYVKNILGQKISYEPNVMNKKNFF